MANISKMFSDYQKTYEYTRNLIETNLNISGGTLKLIPRQSNRDLNIVMISNHPIFLTHIYILSLTMIYYCEDDPSRNNDTDPYSGCQLENMNVEFELTEENILDIVNMLNTDCSIYRRPYMFDITNILREF